MKRILWFSPLPPAETEIANHTARIAPFLMQKSDCWFCHPDDNPTPSGLPAKRISELSARELNQADACVYNLGNNVEFHGQIFELSRKHPGIAVLHDRAIHEFFMGYLKFWSGGAGPEEVRRYRRAMGFWYGQKGIDASQSVLRGKVNPGACSDRFPLYEEALFGALGAVTHNPAVAVELREVIPLLPVLGIALPYPLPAAEPRLSARSTRKGVVRLVTFGFLGRNRRILEFLDAWAASPWRDRFELDIAGRLLEASQVERILAETGLAKHVRLHGFLPEEALDALLREADFALNLRYPSMGEASASQLRIWANGVPSAVTDVGWYSQCPADAVFKIRPPEHEREDLLSLLARLACGQIDLNAIAQAGWRRVKEHAPEVYVEKLLEWMDDEYADAPFQWMMRRNIDRIAREHAAIVSEDYTPTLPASFGLGD